MSSNKQRLIPYAQAQSLSLLTDLYQLTMSYGYWKNGLHNKEAVFHLTFRRSPFKGGFTVAAGLEYVIDFLKSFYFDASDLEYLSTLKSENGQILFPSDFLEYLSTLRFTGNIDAVPEGTVVFPHEPLIRVTAPIIQCQILESPLLNLINFSTLIATKSARVCLAAQNDSVMEFGLRRAQGIDGALTASRSAYIGGCDSTSNVLAGKLFGIPVKGTHSHSWVMAFDDELESFKAYAKVMPDNCILLVDTYDTIKGVERAIEVAKLLKKQGKKLIGIRLDSGDLADLSIKSRLILDKAGFPDVKIVASNELDEIIISELKRQGSFITVWGVGTNLVTAKDQPALDGVYKLSAIRDPGEEWKYRLKLSEQVVKVSNPGILQVKRFFTNSHNVADMIYNEGSPLPKDLRMIDLIDPTKEQYLEKNLKTKDLLQPIFKEGKLVYRQPSLSEIRQNTKDELERFRPGVKRFLNPHVYDVGMEKSLYELKVELIKQIRKERKIK